MTCDDVSKKRFWCSTCWIVQGGSEQWSNYRIPARIRKPCIQHRARWRKGMVEEKNESKVMKMLPKGFFEVVTLFFTWISPNIDFSFLFSRNNFQKYFVLGSTANRCRVVPRAAGASRHSSQNTSSSLILPNASWLSASRTHPIRSVFCFVSSCWSEGRKRISEGTSRLLRNEVRRVLSARFSRVWTHFSFSSNIFVYFLTNFKFVRTNYKGDNTELISKFSVIS